MFLFELAGYLHKTVGELEQTMTVDEFLEWQVVYKMRPFGHYVDHLQLALGFSVVASRLGRPSVKPEKLLVAFNATPDQEMVTKRNTHLLMMFAQRYQKAYEQRQKSNHGHDR